MKTNLIKHFLVSILIIASNVVMSQTLKYNWGKSFEEYFEWYNYEDSYSQGYSIDVDNNNNVITGGLFIGKVDFNPNPNQQDTAYLESTWNSNFNEHREAGYVSKLLANGNHAWVKKIHSNTFALSGVKKVLTDGSNNVYAFGEFGSILQVDNSTVATGPSSIDNVFVIKFNENGVFQWARSISSQNVDFKNATIDNSNYVLLMMGGQTPMTNNTGGAQLSSINGFHTTIIKMNTSGTVVWSKSTNAYTDFSVKTFIQSDASGNVFIGGSFNSDNWSVTDFDPGTGTANKSPNGWNDIYVLKLNSSGIFQWVKTIGGADYEGFSSFNIDSNGDVVAIVLSSTLNTWDVDPSAATANIPGDVHHIWKLSNAGNYISANPINESGSSLQIKATTLDNNNDIYFIRNSSFNVGQFDNDMYYFKYRANGQKVVEFFKTESIYGNDIVVNAQGNIYTTGNLDGNLDADPTSNTFYVGSRGSFVLNWGQQLSTAQFQTTSITKNEGDGFVNVNLNLNYETIQEETVEITIQNGGAVYSSDFNILDASAPTFEVEIPANSTSGSFTVNIVDDQLAEGNESFTATISSCSPSLIFGLNSTLTFQIIDNESTVSIAEEEKEFFRIFPNPTSGLFTISLTNQQGTVNYTLTTLEGRIVKQANNVTTNNIEVDLTNESKGVYLLRINENDSNKGYKIVRQ